MRPLGDEGAVFSGPFCLVESFVGLDQKIVRRTPVLFERGDSKT